MESKLNRPDHLEAAAEVFAAEVAYYFPDPVDIFEDHLANLMGLTRPLGVSDSEWRLIRVAFIEETPSKANRYEVTTSQMVDHQLVERALKWPYG